MSDFPSPEEKLKQFLANKPLWMQKVLQWDFSLTEDELSACRDSGWLEQLDPLREEFETLIRPIPEKWREYIKRRKRSALEQLPIGRTGRPRKDAQANEAAQLHKEGKSYSQVSAFLNRKYGPGTTTPEAVRKLLRSRKSEAPPEKI